MSQPQSSRDGIIKILASLFVVVFAGLVIWNVLPLNAQQADAAEHDIVNVTLQLKDGPVELELWKDVAPKHVERIVTLAKDGFYDGIVFHRVIDGFMAQTGDPTGTGAGGSDLPDLPAEFGDAPFERGSLGMARSQSPDSANSQFFIMFAPAPHLNGQYTNFGRVVSGMEHVDALKKGDQRQNGLVLNPDKIVSMTVKAE